MLPVGVSAGFEALPVRHQLDRRCAPFTLEHMNKVADITDNIGGSGKMRKVVDIATDGG